MPFAIFRKHQKKMLATLTITAMGGFILADSLPNLLGNKNTPGSFADPEVVKLRGKVVKRSEVERLKMQRMRANAFMGALDPQLGQVFGGTSTRDAVDALILEREADELKMPKDAAFGNRWLNGITDNKLSPSLFELVRSRISDKLTGQQILEDIAGQARLYAVQNLPGRVGVTPLDVYETYKDQQEKVSAYAVAFGVADYVPQVGEPAEADLNAFFDKYKAELPDPMSPTPGFKVPRRVQVESVERDQAALAREARLKLTEDELRKAFAARPTEFLLTPPELPADLFKGAPSLTPNLVDGFRQARPLVEATLAEEKAREAVDAQFDRIEAEAMDPFATRYVEATDAAQEAAKTTGKPLDVNLTPGDLVEKEAKKVGLRFERSPLLARPLAENFGTIGRARDGSGQSRGSRAFAEVFFDGKSPLYNPVQLFDAAGRRYLAWKVADAPAYVPALKDVRADVVAAWKLDRARPLAEKAARDLASKATKAGDLKKVAEPKPVITTEPIAKMSEGFYIPPSTNLPSLPNLIPQIPDAGQTLLDAVFALQPKAVVVEPNRPKTIYYALTLNQRTPADFDKLYDTLGPQFELRREAMQAAQRIRDDAWMGSLRRKAGLPTDWVPKDDPKGDADTSG